MDQKPVYVIVHGDSIEEARRLSRRDLDNPEIIFPLYRRMSERVLNASINVLSEIEILVKRGEDLVFIDDIQDLGQKMLDIKPRGGRLYFPGGDPDKITTDRLDIERPRLVGGALYSETIPLCVNGQIHALKKAGYDAQVHPPTTFVAYGDGNEQLSTLLSDPSIQPINLDEFDYP